MNKYKLTSTTKEWCGITLYQIEALVAFGSIAKGELGGWIEKEENLSQVSGDAWVYGNAWVSGDAQVYGNARVYGDAQVYGNARVYGDAWVYGNAQVYGDAWVYGKLRILAGFFFYKKEEIKYKKLDDNYEVIYKGDAKFGEEESNEVESARKLLEAQGYSVEKKP